MRSIFRDIAHCQATPATGIPPSQEALILSVGPDAQQGRYIFLPTSTSPDNNQGQLIVAPTSGGSGRWVRRDPFIDLVLSAAPATVDGAQLVVVPAELTLTPILRLFYEVTTAWAGGTPQISLSFSTPAIPRAQSNLTVAISPLLFTTVCFYAAYPGSGLTEGGDLPAPVLSPGSIIYWDRVTGVATTGALRAHIPCMNYATAITPVTPT